MAEQWEITARDPGLRHVVADVWRHRGLLNYVGDRALKKIYRRTLLGWLWLFINPLFPLAMRALIFGALLGVDGNGLPYFLFLLGGTIAWDAFATSLMWGTRALEMNRGLTEQVYAPRALLPIGNMTPAFLDFGIKVAVFVGTVLFYLSRDQRLYVQPGPGLGWAVLAIALVFLLAVALSFFTSVWGETARDARFALGQVLSVWYLLTPVLYPMSAVAPEYRAWLMLNPLAVLVETFKWGVFGVGEFRPQALGVVAAVIVTLLLGALLYFARAEARAVDAR